MADPAAPLGGDPQEALRRVLDGVEGQVAAGLEQLVAGEGFSKLLVQITENVVAVSRITGDVADLILRNLRLAGRHDVERLGRQLIRTEDKLERLLQIVERIDGTPDHG